MASMRRPSAFSLVVLALAATAGTLGLLFVGLPLADCTLCQGSGRFLVEEARDEIIWPYTTSGCLTHLESRMIYPALYSECNLCGQRGKVTHFNRWRWEHGVVEVGVGRLRQEGPYLPYWRDPATGERGSFTSP